RALRPLVHPVDVVGDAADLALDALGAGEDAPADRRRLVATAAALEERRAVGPGERADAPAHRRLAAAEDARRRGQRSTPRHREEEAKVVPVRHSILHVDYSPTSRARQARLP